MIAKLLTFLLLLYCIRRGKRFDNLFNPYYLVIPTLLSFILYFPIHDYFFTSLSIKTEVLIVMSLIALVIGFNLVFKSKIQPTSAEKREISFPLIFFIGIIPTVLSYYMFGNTLELEGAELEEAREQTTLPIVGQFAYFLQASIVVACKKNKNSLILFSFFASVLAALFIANKSTLMITLVFTVGGLFFFKPNIWYSKTLALVKRFWFVVIPVLLIAMFMYNNNRRAGDGGVSEKGYSERGSATVEIGGGNLAQNLFLDYCYFCTPWSNLNYNVEKVKDYGYGAFTMSQFVKKIGVELKKPEVYTPTFFNTHSYLTHFYIDFGFLGAIIASFILGVFISFCFVKFGKSCDPMLVSFYMLVSFATVMLFFSNHFTIGYLLNYFITFGLTSLFYRSKKAVSR